MAHTLFVIGRKEPMCVKGKNNIFTPNVINVIKEEQEGRITNALVLMVNKMNWNEVVTIQMPDVSIVLTTPSYRSITLVLNII